MRNLDVICVGRAAVDLYGEQIGGRLEDMQSFAKYLGGSPANTSVGSARLGLKSAMLTRVGDEHNGRFVRESLAAEGVDVSHVTTDPKHLTALVFLGIRDRETFPLIFYRHQCADMQISLEDIDADFIASSKALLLSGTHLSQPKTYEACVAAIKAAKKSGTKIALDIDYRPVLWGLTGLGLGEQRFVASDKVSAHLQTVIADCDLMVGTEEEIHIAGGSTDTLAALKKLRSLSKATIVMKRGPMGCIVYDGAIPDDLEKGIVGRGFPIEVFNVLGAGDAFMAGFLRGWLRDEPLTRCCTYANGCGALVVSRHGCAPAMPSFEELQYFIDKGSKTKRVREDADIEHLHRVTTRTRRWKELVVLAYDHRVQLEQLAGGNGPEQRERIEKFKRLVAEGGRRAAGNTATGIGMILDDRYGENTLPTITGQGWWIARPVELPGSRPLVFEHGPQPAVTLRTWPEEHVAKCLVSYHPDDQEELREQQIASLQLLQQACVDTRHEFLIEVIPPRSMPSETNTIARAMDQIYAAGVKPDWWKLPPSLTAAGWSEVAASIERNDPHCRGVVVLGLEASEENLTQSFQVAARYPICKGFAVGRSIFADAAAGWFAGRMNDEEVIADIAERYTRLIELWRDARAAVPRVEAVG